METSTTNYRGNPISFLKLTGNDLVLRTVDVCAVLGISDRPDGTTLARPCLDLASAVNLALLHDADFAMWLNETFVGYNVETLGHPTCDDSWSFD